MILGLGFALVSALGTNLSALFKARGAVAIARPIQVRHPVRSAADLFRSRWFAVGWILALLAWGLHIEALALAPVSTVQAILSGGLVFLAILAERFFGFHLGRRQWAGMALTAAGLAMIGLTATSEGPQRSSLLSPWTLTALVSFVISFYASARSLQIGQAVEVIAITSVAANLSAILGGILVFGEPIGSGAIGIIIRLLAFCLVIAGAALVPAPLRATADPPAQQRSPAEQLGECGGADARDIPLVGKQ